MNANQRKNRRLVLFEQQGGVCCWCGKLMQIGEKDAWDFGSFEHIVPDSHGGTDAISNLLLAHKKCNMERSSDRMRIPFFCWVRREFDSEQLKIVKYLDNPTYAASGPPGPKSPKVKGPRRDQPFDPFARF